MPRPLPARIRRRILLHKLLLHGPLLLVLLLLGGFWDIGQVETSAKAEKVEKEPPVSKETLDLVKYFEGYSATCTDWLDGHATIGHGELLHFGPCTVADNALYVTQKEARATLRKDLLFFRQRVQQLVRVPINKQIEAALISFSYNVGDRGLADSTLLKLLNRGYYEDAARQLDLWIHGPSGPLPGLIKRRAMEKDLFLEGVRRLP